MEREKILKGVAAFASGVSASWLAARLDQTPIIVLLAGGIVCGLVVVALLSNLDRKIWTLLKQERMVASVLVFDGNDVLLVKDDEHEPPWYVPPSAYIGCFKRFKQGPQQAVVREVKNKAGIDIQIDGPKAFTSSTVGTTPLAHPICAQSEVHSGKEGRAIYHDFYYLGRLVPGQSKKIKPSGGYQWIDMKKPSHWRSITTPREMKEIIDLAFELYSRKKKVSS